MERGARDRADELEQGRTAYATRAWLEAYACLERAHAVEPLEPEDLGLLSMAAAMLGRDDDTVVWLERAHLRYLEDGETLPAVRCAAWIGLNLASRGEIGPASGWLGRAHRLVETEGDCAERGLLLLPAMFQHEATGDFAAAAAAAEEAVRIGERFGDRDLFALAVHSQGHMLIRDGRVRDGLVLLDEAMVTVTAEELLPFVTGIVYCGVILACQEVYEVQRAREWTRALAEWWALQPEMVAFTGRCLVHRAEILQLDGEWRDALDEVRRAGERFAETRNPAAGLACYRQGELLRLQGAFAGAERAYKEASAFGWEPQPGLAQLRLAQGRTDAAVSAITRAESETTNQVERARLLPAFVEIMLAAREVEHARRACLELEEVVAGYDSAMLDAMVAHAWGALHLAEGEPREALGPLRKAAETWRALDVPYEIARTRVLIGDACRSLGDEDSAVLEHDAARAAFEHLGAKPDLERLGPPTSGHGLSRRELEVLRLLAAGKTNREIAASLVISEHTVARHVQNIFAKLDLSSRAAATAFAFEHDLV
jgi:DNA-binding CsgD family transcriptional regulator/tetratricopeptide (TPR) repeat protein